MVNEEKPNQLSSEQKKSPVKSAVETMQRWYNKARIYIKWLFGKGVQRHTITDEQGKKHDVTFEQKKEKVCAHTRLEQVYGTFWKCQDCEHFYFEITYKVMLTRTDLLNFMDKLADHFEAEVVDKKEAKKRENEAIKEIDNQSKKAKKKKNDKKQTKQ